MLKSNIWGESEARHITERLGCFAVSEWDKDVSVTHSTAESAFYMSKMNVHKKQVICNLQGNGVIIQSGAMQWFGGDVQAQTNVKGAGDLFKKVIGSAVTNESAIKPKYAGTGTLVLEPTYKYILLEDINEWKGGMTVDDGMFLACNDTVDMKVVSRKSISSAVLGNEGLFNTSFSGSGVIVLESPVPREELIEIQLTNDTVKIDGNMAVAWSTGLQFTVEKTTNTLVGSAVSGEGLVNVYRGTGKILLAPVN